MDGHRRNEHERQSSWLAAIVDGYNTVQLLAFIAFVLVVLYFLFVG